MIHPKERRCESLRTTKNVLESLNQILSIETHSPSEKETRGSDGAQRNLPRTITNQSVKDNHSFFTQYFNRSEMKLRLGFLRRRSTESSLTVRPQPQDAQKWALSFADLMASKYGAALYRAFLEREFSNENLEFWLACEEFKTMKAPKMAAKAQKIYSDFVAVQAPKEVNLDSETRGVTLNNLQANNLDNHVFDRAQRRIQNIMERDSYLRFLQSDLFLELIHPERYQQDKTDLVNSAT